MSTKITGVSMITRQDTRQVNDPSTLTAVYQHPLDRVHWKQVVYLAQQRAWEDMKESIEWMGETYLREHMQSLIHSESPRLYRTLWGEDDES